MLLGGIVLLLGSDDRVGASHFIDPNHLARPGKSVISIPKRIFGEAPLRAPRGFKIGTFAKGMSFPRWLAVAPNGDVFCVESEKSRIIVLRDADGDGRAELSHIFTVGLKGPHGLEFHGGYLYVANTNAIVRFPYRDGQLEAQGQAEIVVPDLPAKGYNMHWTKSLLFTPDGRLMVTIGSGTNDDLEAPGRACILSYKPDGSDRQVLVTGIRNPVGLAIQPGTGDVWTSCIERDFLGNDCPPDFIARVRPGTFYGWPWFYIGRHVDPKHKSDKPPRTDVSVPEILVEPHSIPLQMAFADRSNFPPEYRSSMFVAMRGSTNRVPRSGYKVVRIRFQGGKPNPVYEDFVVGWVPDRMQKGVFGRPVGLAFAKDGAMLVSDEWGQRIWRITSTR